MSAYPAASVSSSCMPRSQCSEASCPIGKCHMLRLRVLVGTACNSVEQDRMLMSSVAWSFRHSRRWCIVSFAVEFRLCAFVWERLASVRVMEEDEKREGDC